MKHNWEYKKWKDVLTIINGKNQKNVECDNGQYPIYGSGGIMGHANDYLCPENTTIIGRKGSINKPLFIATKFWNVDTAFGLVSNSSLLNPKYLFYFCCNYNFETLNKAVTIPSLTKNDLLQIGINVPPISTQQSIVSELDSLSKIIADCKETLKDYDALEQSIFYDMFGDPVKNEKGWEVKKLGEICSKITDGTHNSPINDENGSYMYITAKNIKKDGIVTDDITYVSDEVHKQIYERCNPVYGDVLYIKDGATTGVATINHLKKEFSLLSSVALIKPSDRLNNYYLKEVLNTPSMYMSIRSNMGGAAITRLTLTKICSIHIPLPPLPLQQNFASKIEAIEQMKVETKKALQEAETLFQARMDYWFG